MTPQSLFQFGTVSFHPTPDRRVIRLQPALGEQLFHIAERERVAKQGKGRAQGVREGPEGDDAEWGQYEFGTVFSEGNNVSVQCESNTTAANRRKYSNLYHFYIRFDGNRIAEVREYCDTNHAREVFVP